MVGRRLVLVLSIVFCGSLALAAGAVAAGGGLAPGSYTFQNISASAQFGGGKGGVTPQPFFSVFVNRGLNSFQAADSQGSDLVMSSTMVQFTEFNPNGSGGFGCFLIPAGDFVVSENLQSASVHTTLTAANQCPGFGKPVGPVQLAGTGPGAGGNGGGGLVLPISVDVTWTGAGVVPTVSDEFTFTCLNRQEEGSDTFRQSIGGSASGTIAGVSGLTTLSDEVSSQNAQLDIQGSTTPPCFG